MQLLRLCEVCLSALVESISLAVARQGNAAESNGFFGSRRFRVPLASTMRLSMCPSMCLSSVDFNPLTRFHYVSIDVSVIR